MLAKVVNKKNHYFKECPTFTKFLAPPLSLRISTKSFLLLASHQSLLFISLSPKSSSKVTNYEKWVVDHLPREIIWVVWMSIIEGSSYQKLRNSIPYRLWSRRCCLIGLVQREVQRGHHWGLHV